MLRNVQTSKSVSFALRLNTAKRARGVPCKPAWPQVPNMTLVPHIVLSSSHICLCTCCPSIALGLSLGGQSLGMAIKVSAALLIYRSVSSFRGPFLNSVAEFMDTYCCCYHWFTFYHFLIGP